MIWPIYTLYILTIAFIRVYKWIELQLLKLITPILVIKFQKILSPLGIVLHFEKDGKRTQADNQVVLLEIPNEKYEKLVHLNVHNNSFFPRVANLGVISLCEAFMDGTLTCSSGPDDITELTARCLENNVFKTYYNLMNKLLEWLELYAFNLQTKKRAFKVAEAHYDLGNELFQVMLDPWMQYTCGYWKNADNLNDAQLNKMDLIAKKLELRPGMRVLDIGCGWGTLCRYLAENYKVECVGVSIGKQGVIYGQEICKGLPVDIRLQDYRDVNETFDRIVCAEMLEHVGLHNYQEYFNVVNRCLKDDGIMLLHVTGRCHTFPMGSNPYLQRYIFPNIFVPDTELICKSIKGLFVIEDWQNLGYDFSKTITAWRENFVKGWPKMEDKYDQKFYRLWVFYLSTAIAVFRTRRVQLWQIVLSKDGLKREYTAAR